MSSPLKYYRPPPPLAGFVDFLWQSGPYGGRRSTERVLPTGAMELVIDLATDSRGCGTLSGARSNFHRIDTSRPREFIGARFTIGGGFVFFGPATELQNLSIPLATLWQGAAELQDRLAEAAPGTPRFVLLERFLLRHLDPNQLPSPAVGRAVLRLHRSHGLASIGALAEECGLSRRRFIQIFHDQVGLTPKLYGRLRRFRRSIAAIQSTREVNWADLAAACGYSDQPHLIHEFRAFTGLTPSVYLRNRTSHLNHVRDPA